MRRVVEPVETTFGEGPQEALLYDKKFEAMKYFFRFLKNNPLYAVINMVGLALSLMFVILIGDYTYRQFSIDKWHRNHERIYVLGTENRNSLMSWPDCAHSLKDRYPEVEDVCCVYMHNGKIKHEDRVYEEAQGDNAGNIMLADSNFFRFFDFKMIDGDRETALDSPEKCVVTESLAKALFPDGNALGQPLQIEGTRYVFVSDDNGDPYDSSLVYTVSGVIKDLDKTVFLNETAVIANFERAPQVLGYRLRNDLMASGPLGSTLSFLMLRPGANLDDKIDDLTDYCAENIPMFDFYGKTNAALIPLDGLMFAPQNNGAGLQTGDKSLFRNITGRRASHPPVRRHQLHQPDRRQHRLPGKGNGHQKASRKQWLRNILGADRRIHLDGIHLVHHRRGVGSAARGQDGRSFQRKD